MRRSLTDVEAETLFQAAQLWARQGSRSRWSTTPSLVLYDIVKLLEEDTESKEDAALHEGMTDEAHP